MRKSDGNWSMEDGFYGIKSDPSQRYKHLRMNQLDLPFEIGATIRHLLRSGFIPRWSAAADGGYVKIFQHQPIRAEAGFGLGSKTSTIQGRVEEIT